MVTITNVTRGTVLAATADEARGLWRRLMGLIGRTTLTMGDGLLFPGTQGVHTHFMRFPIDVVFYDRDHVVLDVVHELRPWRISPYRWRARGVIELPAGTARATGTRRGDVLTIA